MEARAALAALTLPGIAAFHLAPGTHGHALPCSTLRSSSGSCRASFWHSHRPPPLLRQPPHRGGRTRESLVPGRVSAAAASITTVKSAVIFPAQGLKGALLPIILVVVLCLLAAIPLGPSLTQKAPELVGTPGSESYEKGARIKRVLGLQRRVFTSVMLGALVSAWIFSGTWGFAAVLCVAGARALLEYYDMAALANDCRWVWCGGGWVWRGGGWVWCGGGWFWCGGGWVWCGGGFGVSGWGVGVRGLGFRG